MHKNVFLPHEQLFLQPPSRRPGFYYEFRNNSSGTVAVVGLVNDDRAASITLSYNGKSGAEAALHTGAGHRHEGPPR
jgi:hypothetical protein